MSQSQVSADGSSFDQHQELTTPVRATQNTVGHLGFCWRHPSLTAIEVGWRWLVGIPFLLIAQEQMHRILAQLPTSAAGLDRLEWANPWLSSVLIAQAVGKYEPYVVSVLRWLAPLGIVAWAVASALGRVLILLRMRAIERKRGLPATVPDHLTFGMLLRRVPGLTVLQALWMLALLTCWWGWFETVGWASGNHLTDRAQPDLVGYLCWLIFLSLGFFTLWSLLSWTLSAAPLLLAIEGDNRVGATLRALARSFRLGKPQSGKLAEVNLVMAIVKLALVVLAMVFSSAPIPFSDEFGPDTLHTIDMIVIVWYLIANDFFHVVRFRSFCALWRHYRG